MGHELLVFELAGRLCGLPVRAVREIVPMAELGRPPGLPSLLEGFLNLHGAAVPVLRLNRLFGLPAQAAELYTPLVILRGDPHPLALLVDRVAGIFSPSMEAFRPVAENNCFNDCAEAELTLADGVVHLLSAERLLLEKERQCLAEFQARAQEYLNELEAAKA